MVRSAPSPTLLSETTGYEAGIAGYGTATSHPSAGILSLAPARSCALVSPVSSAPAFLCRPVVHFRLSCHASATALPPFGKRVSRHCAPSPPCIRPACSSSATVARPREQKVERKPVKNAPLRFVAASSQSSGRGLKAQNCSQNCSRRPWTLRKRRCSNLALNSAQRREKSATALACKGF